MAGPAAKRLQPPYFDTFTQLIALFKDHPRLVIQLQSDDSSHHECIRCGEGCLSDWKVLIDKAYYKKWLPFWAHSQNPDLRKPFIPLPNPTTERYAYLRKQADGKSCLFLRAPATCMIHHHYGLEAKPLSCQRYPQMEQLSPQGYAVNYLLKSCSIAPELMLKYPHISYRLMQLAPDAPVTLPQQNQLPLPQFYLWLGLVLDTLGSTPQQPLHKFARLKKALTQLNGRDTYQLQTTDFAELKSQLNRLPPETKITTTPELNWLVELENDFFPEFKSLTLNTDLTAQENHYLNHYLWLYLRQAVLIQGYKEPFRGQLSLYQHYFVIAIFIRQIMRLALSFRQIKQVPLNFHHLGRATNLMARRMIQNTDWFHGLMWHRLSNEQYIQRFDHILNSLLI